MTSEDNEPPPEDSPRVKQSLIEAEADEGGDATHRLENQQQAQETGGQDHGGHGDHGGIHEGHEQLFRRRFFISTALSIPVLLYSETLQGWLGFSVP